VAWEFTGQTAETCNYIDGLLNVVTFQPCGQTYVGQLLQAQNHAPFGDGLGLTGSTLQLGDTLAPLGQCLNTPFQCVPERPALAATNWAIYADQDLNPFAFASVTLSASAITFPNQPLNTTSATISITITNGGTGALKIASAIIMGPESPEFAKTSDTCSGVPVAAGASCTIGVSFTPAIAGTRIAALAINGNALGSPQLVSLTGTGIQVFTLAVSKLGNGTGSVNSSDGAINCGVTCIASFSNGTTVNLTATPDSSSFFAGWSGACTGTGSCQVAMTQAQTVSAIFNVLVPTSGLRFVPVTPCRVADTRNPVGPFGGPFLGAQTTRGFQIPSSSCGIPATAQAYSVNLTVVPHSILGFLTMFACGQTRPFTSTLNSVDGRVKAASALVPAGTNGSICAFVTHDTELIIDINGYFVPGTDPTALAFSTVTPCRLVDTRTATGPLGGPSLPANTARVFPILSSSCNIPATAQAYSMNFTVVPKSALGFLTTWPTGQPQPFVSTLNAPTGAVTANAAIVPVGAGGNVSVFVTHDTDLVIDINGYFAPPLPGGLSLFNLPSCRVLDTRIPAGASPFSGERDVNVVSSGCSAPLSAKAFALNATVVPPGPFGFLTLWPQGTPQPFVSTLNAPDGTVTSNLAIVPTTNGSVSAFASNPTHLVLDISGYFAP
jgi:hypothetical protein